jgi:oligopeptide transport system permease protein
VSLSLGLLAFGFAIGVGIPVGFYTAVRRGEWTDSGGSFRAAVDLRAGLRDRARSLAMVFGAEAALAAARALGLAATGRAADGHARPLLRRPRRAAHARGHDADVAEPVHPHRAGERARRIRGAHAARLPARGDAGRVVRRPMLADLPTGSFVVQSIFQIPGIGVFIVDSSRSRDYPLAIGLVLLYAVLLLVLNLVVDLAYGLLDPRVKYE